MLAMAPLPSNVFNVHPFMLDGVTSTVAAVARDVAMLATANAAASKVIDVRYMSVLLE